MPSIHVLRTELRRAVGGARDSVRSKGLLETTRRVFAVAGGQLAEPITARRRRDERFEFQGERLPYTFVRYNNSFLNERAIEISIAKWFLADSQGPILEVGNVLAHYGVSGHTVLDKYEVIPGVLNEDIVDYVPSTPFQTVIAISTLEHVGWDETPRDPGKVLRAIESVKACVAPGGRALVTMPLGYNTGLDGGLRDGAIQFDEVVWMVRASRRNEWVEAGKDEALAKEYGRPYTGANGLYVGMITG